jgi:hypothetical protein
MTVKMSAPHEEKVVEALVVIDTILAMEAKRHKLFSPEVAEIEHATAKLGAFIKAVGLADEERHTPRSMSSTPPPTTKTTHRRSNTMTHSLSRPTEAPALYTQEGKAASETTVYAHYFVAGCDWWITEYDPAEDVAFGFACLNDPQNAELGYVSIAELESVKLDVGHLGAAQCVEKDRHWDAQPLAPIIQQVKK